jgi:hypothetical protein
MMHHKPTPYLLLLLLLLLSLSLSLVEGHGGPMKNSYMPNTPSAHWMAEWVTYEVVDSETQEEVVWGNFTVQVKHNGTIHQSLVFPLLFLHSI